MQVFGVSTDSGPTLSHWAKEMGLTYPLLSDKKGEVSKLYGVLNPDSMMAGRTTFVVDTEGRIQHIEAGSAAVDPTGAETACKRIRKK
ncbi:MAG: peroxiredoxin family protein [Acidobacteria bacterium]|nr:peroxiredoxin family protein [Acidobacteriota bacterium]